MLICCFLERKHFSVDISAKLGSSFSLVPFIIVVVRFIFSQDSTFSYAVSVKFDSSSQGFLSS